MLPSWSRRYVQGAVQSELREVCVIRRTGEGVDATYGTPTDGAVSEVTTRCFLSRVNRAGEGMIADADKGRVFYMANLPHDADVRDGDTLVIGGDDYETVQVMSRHSNDVMVQALVVKAGS